MLRQHFKPEKGGFSLKTVTVYDNVKVKVVEETPVSTVVRALEDALIKDDKGEWKRIEAGKLYIFCSCCFAKRKREAF
jgi:hypothetical protein